jgi:hypothetical protein
MDKKLVLMQLVGSTLQLEVVSLAPSTLNNIFTIREELTRQKNRLDYNFVNGH